MIFPDTIVHRVLWRTQRGRCAGCGGPMRQYATSADHCVPLARGGGRSFGNLIGMHGRCNSRKGHRMPTGCELIWLLAVNARLGVGPQTFARAA